MCHKQSWNKQFISQASSGGGERALASTESVMGAELQCQSTNKSLEKNMCNAIVWNSGGLEDVFLGEELVSRPGGWSYCVCMVRCEGRAGP